MTVKITYKLFKNFQYYFKTNSHMYKSVEKCMKIKRKQKSRKKLSNFC